MPFEVKYLKAQPVTVRKVPIEPLTFNLVNSREVSKGGGGGLGVIPYVLAAIGDLPSQNHFGSPTIS